LVNFFTKLYNFAYNKKFTSSAASFDWRTFFCISAASAFLFVLCFSLAYKHTHTHTHTRARKRKQANETQFFFTMKSFPATFCVEFS